MAPDIIIKNSRQEIKNYYHLSDLVVVPSICLDSFRTMNLEAMDSGKPVIATLFGGSREVVEDKKTGFLVNPLDVGKLAGKMIYLLENSPVATEMGSKGFDRIKKEFSLEKWIDQILKFY